MNVLRALLLLCCAGLAVPVPAHDDIHIVGTLVRVLERQIEVRSATGRVAHLRLDGLTVVKQGERKLEATQLRAGQRVFVEAWGDSDDDAVVIEIRIMTGKG